jgi:hypothetical protein
MWLAAAQAAQLDECQETCLGWLSTPQQRQAFSASKGDLGTPQLSTGTSSDSDDNATMPYMPMSRTAVIKSRHVNETAWIPTQMTQLAPLATPGHVRTKRNIHAPSRRPILNAPIPLTRPSKPVLTAPSPDASPEQPLMPRSGGRAPRTAPRRLVQLVLSQGGAAAEEAQGGAVKSTAAAALPNSTARSSKMSQQQAAVPEQTPACSDTVRAKPTKHSGRSKRAARAPAEPRGLCNKRVKAGAAGARHRRQVSWASGSLRSELSSPVRLRVRQGSDGEEAARNNGLLAGSDS